MGINAISWGVVFCVFLTFGNLGHALDSNIGFDVESNVSSDVESDFEFKTTDITDIVGHVKESTSLLEVWADEINEKDYNLLCLGETHNNDFRFFYGETLKLLDFKSLALELKEEPFEQLIKDWEEQKPLYILNATFDPIAEAVDLKEEKVKVFGVEPTQEQKVFSLNQQLETGKREYSRDGFIAKNIVDSFTDGEKMVALYGSHHCRVNNQGAGTTPFANHLKKYWGSQKVLNVRVFNRNSVSSPHPLISFVDSLSEFRRKTVVVSSEKLQPEMHNYNWDILKLTKNFDYIIIR